MKELLENLEFMKSQFKNSQNAVKVGSEEWWHYLGIIQGFKFAIDELKKLNKNLND